MSRARRGKLNSDICSVMVPHTTPICSTVQSLHECGANSSTQIHWIGTLASDSSTRSYDMAAARTLGRWSAPFCNHPSSHLGMLRLWPRLVGGGLRTKSRWGIDIDRLWPSNVLVLLCLFHDIMAVYTCGLAMIRPLMRHSATATLPGIRCTNLNIDISMASPYMYVTIWIV